MTRHPRLIFAAALAAVVSVSEAAPFTNRSAPDPISRSILEMPLQRLHEGPLQSVDANRQIHQNFPQIIEQNFARLDKRAMSTLVNALSEAELSDLAQLYVNAATDFGRPQRLLYVLAHRLDGSQLGRLAKHFGFAPIYEAVVVVAPEKGQAFLESTRADYEAPRPGEMRFGTQGRFTASGEARVLHSRSTAHGTEWRILRKQDAVVSVGLVGGVRKVAFGQFLNYTPYEVYLSFRTAPVGALAVTGALWETTFVLSGTMLPAYGTGYAIGTHVVKPLIETYAPSLYSAIGSSIGTVVETMSNSWAGTTQVIANTQRSTATTFQATSAQRNAFVGWGGDFGCAFEWSFVYGGGTSCWTCPRYDPY